MQVKIKGIFKRMFLLFTVLSILVPITLPAPALAESDLKTKSFFFTVLRSNGGYLVSYPICVYNYYRADWTTEPSGYSFAYNVQPQKLGGVIYNANRPGYYPFSQTISRGYVKRYKNGSYYTSYEFSIDSSGSIHDPNDKPYGFKYVSNVNLYDGDSNEMRPFIYWVANGTIPSSKTLQGTSMYF